MESLGPLIGEGRTAEVFSYDTDRALKLLRPGFATEAISLEAEKTAAAFAAGAPAPRFHGYLEVESRPGAVYDKVEGPSLFDEIGRAPLKFLSWARELGRLHARLLSCSTAALPDVKEVLVWKIERADALSPAAKTRARDELVHLPDGASVLHGDLHPLNVFMSSSGPVIIDWLDAARGAPGADIARSLWLASAQAIPPNLPGRSRLVALVRGFRLAYLRTVLRGAGLRYPEILQWRLPVVAGRLGEGIAHEEAVLLREVDRLSR